MKGQVAVTLPNHGAATKVHPTAKFELSQRQFPVCLEFSVINKAQGQSLKFVEISLEVFSHGQLYM